MVDYLEDLPPPMTPLPEGAAMQDATAGDIAYALIADPKWHFKRMPPDRLYWYDNDRGAYVPCQFGDGLHNRIQRWSVKQPRRRAFAGDVLDTIFTHLDAERDALWQVPPLDSINIRNGVLSIFPFDRPATIRKHSSDYLVKGQLAVEVDPNNPPGRPMEIDSFLGEVMDEGIRKVFDEMAGVLCVPFTHLHKAFVLRGSGANGKSTAMAMLQAMLGEDNWSNISFRQMTSRFGLVRMLDNLANFMSETDFKNLKDTDVFKAVVAGEPVTMEDKGQALFRARIYARLVMALDDVSGVTDMGYGFQRRIVLLDFPNTIQYEVLGKSEMLTTEEEVNGYFWHYALPGLQRVLKNGRLTEVTDKNGQPRRFLSPLVRMYEECFAPVTGATTKRSQVGSIVTKWCEEEAIEPGIKKSAAWAYLESKGHSLRKSGEWVFDNLEVK